MAFDVDPSTNETTRDQWQDAAEAWHRWEPTFDAWLGPATERMLDLTEVGEGSRVLDVAAGVGRTDAGGSAFAGAEPCSRPTSREAILEYAAAEARRAGFERVATRALDGEKLDVEPGTFDAVISRLGIMYFPDKPRAIAEQHRALRAGGWFGAIVFAEGEANGFFSVPIGIIRRRAELPPPAPGLPGPFSATGIGALLDDAGFHDVRVERVSAPLRLANAAECTRLERESFGALHQMLAGLDEAEQADAWGEIEQALGQFEGPEGFVGPCELLVATASA